MMISLIAAMGSRREIGRDNELLWHLPGDMKHFKQTTMGKPILMGRKTFESFGARPLPGRKNIIITRDQSYRAEGAVVVHSIDEALLAVEDAEEVMIIGGASFYEQMLPRADRIYLTHVDGEFEADSWFPEVDRSQWRQLSLESHQPDERHVYAYKFELLQRIRKDAVQ